MSNLINNMSNLIYILIISSVYWAISYNNNMMQTMAELGLIIIFEITLFKHPVTLVFH